MFNLRRVNIDLSDKPKTIFKLQGKDVVMTGTCGSKTRLQWGEWFSKNGAFLQDRINKNTSLLIVGEDPGMTKLNQARKLNINQVTFADFAKTCWELKNNA